MALRYAGPATIAAFRTVTDPALLGRLEEPHRLQLGAEMMSQAASFLYQRDQLPDQVVALHDAQALVAGAEFFAVPGHQLGGFGLLQRDGQVFVHDRVQPPGCNALIGPETMPAHWMQALVSNDARVIDCDEPVGVVLNPHMVWGHFLLEMLPRVYLLAKLRELGFPVRVAVPTDAPDWAKGVIGLYFSPAETISYSAATQRVRAPCFILPSMLQLHYVLHPMMNLVVSDLLARIDAAFPAGAAAGAPATHIYLSRRNHTGWHRVPNEAAVEELLANHGFRIVHPQQLPLHWPIMVSGSCIRSNCRCTSSSAWSVARSASSRPIVRRRITRCSLRRARR